MMQKIKFISITKEHEGQARNLVLEGLLERFGSIDESLNPDLKNIFETYTPPERIFLIGLIKDEVVCTGALSTVDHSTGRIERMSVKKAFRKIGLGKRLLKELENLAQTNYQDLILETNNDWISAVSFYKSNGYTVYMKDEECTHFVKKL